MSADYGEMSAVLGTESLSTCFEGYILLCPLTIMVLLFLVCHEVSNSALHTFHHDVLLHQVPETRELVPITETSETMS